MNNQNLESELKKLGLSDKESKVYLASLTLGQATAADIAKHSGVNRATTYVIIEELKSKGLMSSFDKDKKTFFAPEPPEQLEKLFEIEQRKLQDNFKELSKIIPDLQNLFESKGERPKVRFYEGKEGLDTIKDEILKVSDKEIFAFFPVDDLDTVFNEAEVRKYFERRVKKGIKVWGIYNRAKGPFEKIAEGYSLRIIPKNIFPIAVDITIFSDRVAVSSLQGKLIGVIIENKEIAKTFQTIFKLAWEAAEKYQKK